jgi:hypothetical protein
MKMGMSLITALEIESHWPDFILIEANQYKDTKKWMSEMFMLNEDKSIHKVMLSYDRNEKWPGFDTEKEAIDALTSVATGSIEWLKLDRKQRKTKAEQSKN